MGLRLVMSKPFFFKALLTPENLPLERTKRFP
jgi:hypothetical protein